MGVQAFIKTLPGVVFSEARRANGTSQTLESDYDSIVVEVLPLTNYVRSAGEHQDRLARYPNDYCHIPEELLGRYKKEG